MKLHQNSGCCTAWIFKYMEVLIITQQFFLKESKSLKTNISYLFHPLFTIIKVTCITMVEYKTMMKPAVMILFVYNYTC